MKSERIEEREKRAIAERRESRNERIGGEKRTDRGVGSGE
jgi:hypothetical protein